MYRLLRHDAQPYSWNVRIVRGVDIVAVNSGRPAPEIANPLRVVVAAQWNGEPSDFLEQPCAIVSSAVREVFDDLGIDNIQYFKAELQIERTHTVIDGYWIANVIGRVACADRLASTFESGDDEAGPVISFEIDPARTYGLSIFRLAEDHRMLVVSPRVQAALRAAKLRGIYLQDASGYESSLPAVSP